jgi:hypothetical protein
MIVNRGTYNYHGVVKSLYSGKSEENNLKYTVVKAYGQCEVTDATASSGKRIKKQDLTIFCHGGLSEYIDAEISEGDKIMVVGHIITKTKNKGSVFYYEQCIQAEEVYKNDWAKYYKI